MRSVSHASAVASRYGTVWCAHDIVRKLVSIDAMTCVWPVHQWYTTSYVTFSPTVTPWSIFLAPCSSLYHGSLSVSLPRTDPGRRPQLYGQLGVESSALMEAVGGASAQ